MRLEEYSWKTRKTTGKKKTEYQKIRNFYRRNKPMIKQTLERNFPGRSDAALAKIFYKNVEAKMEAQGKLTKGSAKKALTEVLSTQMFKYKREVMAENALSGLKTDKDAWKRFRNIVGWKEKFDPSKMTYNKETKGYEYQSEKGAATIYFDNSPKRIRVEDTTEEVFQL